MTRILRFSLSVLFLLAAGFSASAQSNPGCRITLSDLTVPTACLGGELSVCFTVSCDLAPPTYRVEVGRPTGVAPFYDFTAPLAQRTQAAFTTNPDGSRCITVSIPASLDTTLNYPYRIVHPGSNLVSNVKYFTVRSIDRSPSPIIVLGPPVPNKTLYCPDDSITFRISQLIVNRPEPPPTFQWFIVNDGDTTLIPGAIRSVLTYNDWRPGDCVVAFVTKGNPCAVNATAFSAPICLNIKRRPTIGIRTGGSGCADSTTVYLADTANGGVGSRIEWLRNGVPIPGATTNRFVLLPGVAACRDQIRARLISVDCPDTVSSNILTVQECGRVRVETVVPTQFCAGDSLRVDYSTVACFSPSNVFTFQLSDQNGSFANPTDIGAVADTNGGSATLLLPAGLVGGTGYLLRITSSAPQGISLNSFGPLTVFPRPAVVTQQPAVRCGPGNITLQVQAAGAVSFNWYTAQVGGIRVTRPGGALVTTDTFTLFVNRDTTFYVEAVNANGCRSLTRTPVTVTVGAPITVSAGPNQEACEGGACIQLVGGSPVGGTYFGRGVTGSAFCPGDSLPADTYTIRYVYVSPIGCRDSAEKLVVVRPVPRPDAGTADTVVCKPGPPFNFQLRGATPPGGVWTGVGVSSDGIVTVNQLANGANVLTYTITEGSCSRSDTRTLRTSSGPQVTVTPASPTSCDSANGTVTLNPFDATWTVSFFKADNTPVTPTGSGPTYGGFEAGAYLVRLREGTGCESEFGFTINDIIRPTVTISGLASAYCTSEPCLNLTGSPAGGTFSASRTPSGGIDPITGLFCPGQFAPGSLTVTYTFTDAVTGCTGSAIDTTEINLAPGVSPERDTTVCANAGQFALSAGGVWTGSAAIVGTPPTQFFNPQVAGTVNVLTKTVVANGCSTSVQKTIFVNPIPTPILSPSGNQTICQGGSLSLTVTLVDSRPLPAPGISFVLLRNGSNAQFNRTGLFTLTEAGSYRVLALDSAGCSDTSATALELIIDQLGNVSAGADTSICRNAGDVTLVGTPPAGGSLVAGFFGPGIVTPGGNVFNAGLLPAGTASATVRYVVRRGACADSAFRTITILEPLAASLSAQGSPRVCQGTVTLVAAPTGPGTEYTFLRNDTVVRAGGSAPLFVATRSGSYKVIVFSNLPGACPDTSAAVEVEISTPPTLPTLTNINVCQGDGSQALAGPQQPFTSFAWYGPGVDTLAPNSYSWNPVRAGLGTSVLTIVVRNGACADSTTRTATVNPAPVFSLVTEAPSTCTADDGVIRVRGLAGDTTRYTITINPGDGNKDTVITGLIRGSYSVTVVDRLTGCSSILSTTIVAPGDFQATLASVAAFLCRNATPVQLSAQPQNATSTFTLVPQGGGSGITVPAPYLLDPSTVAPGIYNLVYSVDSGGCSGRDTAEIEIRRAPSSRFTPAGQTTICQGNPVTLAANCGTSSTFQWSLNGSTTLPPTVTGQGTCNLVSAEPGLYSLRVDSAGCSSEGTSTLTLNTRPGPDYRITETGSRCAGSTIFLTANGFQAGDVLVWKFNGSPIPGQTGENLTVTQDGTYSVEVTRATCADTATATITFAPVPRAGLTGNLRPCEGTSTTLTATAAGVTYRWINAAGDTVSQTQTFSTATAGAYRLLVIDPTSRCSSDTTFNLEAQPRPDTSLSITGATTFCQGGQVTLSAPDPGSLATLVGGPGQPLGGNAFSITQSGTYYIRLSAGGCQDSTRSVQITVNPTPLAVIRTPAADVNICQGQRVPFLARGTDGQTYEWQVNGTPGTAVADSNFVFDPATPGNYTVTVIVRNAACSATATPIRVTVRETPTASLVALGDTVVCPGQQVTLVGNAFQGINPEFYLDGATIVPSAGVPTVRNVNVAGTYTTRITLNGCTDTSNAVRLINRPVPRPVIANSDTSICVSSAPFALRYTPALGTVADTTVSFDEPYVAGGTFNPAVAGIGRKQVTLRATSLGCSRTDTMFVTVVPGFSTLVAPAATTICAQTTAQFSAVIDPRQPGATYTYQWYRRQPDGTDVAIAGATDSVYTAADSGRYVVEAQVGECTSRSIAAVLNFFPFTRPNAGRDTALCVGAQAITLPVVPAGGIWSGPGVEPGGRFDPVASLVGRNSLVYTTNQDNCILRDTVVVTVNPLPLVTVSYFNREAGALNTPIDILRTAELRAEGATSYVWSPSTGLSTTTGATVEASPRETTTYTVVGTTNGCSASSTVRLEVRTDVRVANGFSPNEDNENDFWNIYNIQAYPNADVRVYNRWGALVYRAKGTDLSNYENYWRGTQDGKPLPVGAYYYTIDLGNNQKPIIGSVTLVR